MKSRAGKLLLVCVKLAVGAALLTWVLSQVHWHDYVVAKDGKEYSAVRVQDGQVTVRTGAPWNRSEQTMPAGAFQTLPKSDEIVHRGFASSISGVNVPLLILAAGGFVASLLVIACRWWFLLRLLDIRIRLWESIRLTFLGQFFNAVVPGTVGGDLVKAYFVFKHTHKKAGVLVSLFVDRMLGLTELTLLAAVMLVLAWSLGLSSLADLRTPALTVAAVVVLVAGAFGVLLSRRLRKALHLQRFYSRLPLAHHFAAAGEAATLYRQRIGSLLQAVAITFGGHIIWIGSIALIGLSLGLPAPVYSYFLYVPLIYIIGAVPLTPGGVGLIETLYVSFFAMVSPSQALVLALLARLVPMFWGLPGVMVAVSGPKLPKARQMEQELGLGDVNAAESAERRARPDQSHAARR